MIHAGCKRVAELPMISIVGDRRFWKVSADLVVALTAGKQIHWRSRRAYGILLSPLQSLTFHAIGLEASNQ